MKYCKPEHWALFRDGLAELYHGRARRGKYTNLGAIAEVMYENNGLFARVKKDRVSRKSLCIQLARTLGNYTEGQSLKDLYGEDAAKRLRAQRYNEVVARESRGLARALIRSIEDEAGKQDGDAEVALGKDRLNPSPQVGIEGFMDAVMDQVEQYLVHAIGKAVDMQMAFERDKSSNLIAALQGQADKAKDLERKLDRAHEKISNQATEIQELSRKGRRNWNLGKFLRT